MAIILSKGFNIRLRLRSKVMGTYIIIILLLALLLNIFMVETIKHRVLQIRYNDMIASARLFSADVSNYIDNNDYLSLLTKEYGEKHNLRMIVFDRNQVVLADSLQDDEILGRQLDYEEVEEALRGRSRAMAHYISLYDDWVIYASSPVHTPHGIQGAVLVSAYANDLFQLVYDIRLQIFYITLILLFVVSIVSYFFSTTITKPIIEIAEAAKRVSKGALGEQVKIRKRDEIGRLADTFNDMSSKLKSNDEKRRRFFHNASHELKTPLTSAILLTDSIVYDLENGKTPPYEFMLDVKEQLYRLQDLVAELSVIAKLDDDSLKEEKRVTLDMHDVVNKVLVTFKPIINQKNLDLRININQNEDYYIKGNLNQIMRALTNIIENAVKYTEPGGKIVISLDKIEQDIVIKIKDTGIGIPREDIDNVFERFYRVDEARSRDKGGSGLGLSIAKEIIEHHNGMITINSNLGEGTMVEITLTTITD